MTYELTPEPPRDRRPMLALFVGGLLSGAAIVVLALTLTGVIGPAAAEPSADGSLAPAASAELGGPLVTPPPVASPSAFTPTDLADGYALGREDAPVTVEIWADYQCPYCALFSQQVEPQLIAQYVETGQVRLVFRDLAFLGDESRWAAVAARLAAEQDAFWPYHDYLFANQLGENVGSFSVERLQQIATMVGLDRSAFDAGLQLDAAREAFADIRADFEADAARLGIRSTPTVVVDGTRLEANDLATIRAAIDAALAD
ncbi:MAG TPA: thioredoxin domain-containing protein [Candidatus Limnocylindria bacterium]